MIENNDNGKKNKTISPFDPEAIVPLPFQLTDFKARSVGTTVWKRNERERYRVRCVNEAYEHLRDQLPFDEDEKRLSKVETLKLAIIYIRHLEAILMDERHIRGCNCFEEFQRQLIESESKRFR
uniref:BHLH domain-containing protein n=1 Tax=Panagrolaimus sp. PS1159 TaxID=55785 RepID=A0AC35FKA8_9BILA